MVFKLYNYYKEINKYEKTFIPSMHEKHRYLAWFRSYNNQNRIYIDTIHKEKCRVLKIILKSNKRNKLKIKKGEFIVRFK